MIQPKKLQNLQYNSKKQSSSQSKHNQQVAQNQPQSKTLDHSKINPSVKTNKIEQKTYQNSLPQGQKNIQSTSYTFHIGDRIINDKKKMYNIGYDRWYQMLQLLGEGTFGQVILCRSSQGHRMAIKIYKKQPAYINQGLIQVKILREISKIQKATNGSKQNYINIYDAFMWQGFLCVVMQVMDNSLLQILQTGSYRGLQMKWIQIWAKQILQFLIKIHAIGICHCDIKPQNIMFRPQRPNKPILIDFSSACTADFQPFTYIQSRFYRAPQVLIGMKPYNQKIDIWSLGCSLVQLYLGLPLFPGGCSYDQIHKICNVIEYKNFPIQNLTNSQYGLKYFKKNKESETQGTIQLISKKQFTQKIVQNDDCYKFQNIGDILTERNYAPKQTQIHQLFIDLIKKMLVFDPNQRISAQQAYLHPFVGGIYSQLEQIRQIQQMGIKAKIC